jgi:glutathione S-transferase
MAFCDIMSGAHKTPEFAAVNPFAQIPALEDGAVKMGESSAILHYIANKYKPTLYPAATSPEQCAKIDFAMDAFSSYLYKDLTGVQYPLLGFVAAPADYAPAARKLEASCAAWEAAFLTGGKFVNGDELSIADFKVLPFFFSICEPGAIKASGFVPTARMVAYVADLLAALGDAAAILSSAGGFSLKEMMAKHA